MKNHLSFLLITTAIAAMLAGSGSIYAGRILFIMDHEAGQYAAKMGTAAYQTGKGKSCKQGKNCHFEIVQSPVNSAIGSKRALKHKVTNSDERAEAGMQYGMMFKGMECWIVYSAYFPKNGGSAICQQGGASTDQVHERRKAKKARFLCNSPCSRYLDCGPPGSYLSHSGSTFNYKLYPWNERKGDVDIFGCKTYSWAGAPEKWHTLVFHVTMGNEKNPYQIWCNDKMVVNENIAIWNPDAFVCGAWKVGRYTGNPGKGTHVTYSDDMYMGTGYASKEEFLADTPYGTGHKTRISGLPRQAYRDIRSHSSDHFRMSSFSLFRSNGSLTRNRRIADNGNASGIRLLRVLDENRMFVRRMVFPYR